MWLFHEQTHFTWGNVLEEKIKTKLPACNSIKSLESLGSSSLFASFVLMLGRRAWGAVPELMRRASCRHLQAEFLTSRDCRRQTCAGSWASFSSAASMCRRGNWAQKRLNGFSNVHSGVEEESRLSARSLQHPDTQADLVLRVGRITLDWCALAGGIGKLPGLIVASDRIITYSFLKSRACEAGFI